MKCQSTPANKTVLSNNPDPCLCWWRSLAFSWSISFSNMRLNIVFAIEIQQWKIYRRQSLGEAQNEVSWAAVWLISYTSGCLRCPWHGMDTQDNVRAQVLLVARDLFGGLGRHYESPSSVKNSSRTLCWWHMHTGDQKGDLATLSCRVVPQFSHILTRVLTWWTALLIMPVAHEGISWDGMQQRARPGGAYILFVWNTGCEKACKKAHRLFGEPNNNFLYSEILHFLLLRHFHYPHVISCGKRGWEPFEVPGLSRRGSARRPEWYLQKAWAMAMWVEMVCADWDPSPAVPPQWDLAEWKSFPYGLGFFLPDSLALKTDGKIFRSGSWDDVPIMMRDLCCAFCLHGGAQAIHFCIHFKHPFFFELFTLLFFLTFQFWIRSHARNARHVCIQSVFSPDPSE